LDYEHEDGRFFLVFCDSVELSLSSERFVSLLGLVKSIQTYLLLTLDYEYEDDRFFSSFCDGVELRFSLELCVSRLSLVKRIQAVLL
jgi:hypothetical protein